MGMDRQRSSAGPDTASTTAAAPSASADASSGRPSSTERSRGVSPSSPPTRRPEPLAGAITQSRASYLAALQTLLEDARLLGDQASVRHYISLIGRTAGFTDEPETPDEPTSAVADRELVLRLCRKLGITAADLAP